MKKVILIFLMSFWILSCQQSADTTQENKIEQNEEEMAATTGSSEEIALDEGRKWLVNDEMKPFIESGEALLNNYIADQGENSQLLADKLKEENDSLIKSCTMTGKSHEELHKWLHPHLELVAALRNSADKNDADKIVHELKESFEVYHQYFE